MGVGELLSAKFITKRTSSKTQFNSDTANIIILKIEKLNKTCDLSLCGKLNIKSMKIIAVIPRYASTRFPQN
jgi:hypothetical protein